jgi:hypothetical protein
VQAALFDEREDQDLGAAFLGLVDRSPLEHEGRLYDGQLNIVKNGELQPRPRSVLSSVHPR